MEHLRGAGLVARPVAQEIGQLLLRLGLVRDIARALQALGARDRRHHRGEVGELRGLKRDKLVAGLRGLEGAGGPLARRNEPSNLGAGGGEVLHHAGLDAHGVLESGERVLPAGLRARQQLLRGGRTRIGLRVGLSEGLIDGSDAVGDPLRLGQELLGLVDRLLELGRARNKAGSQGSWPG